MAASERIREKLFQTHEILTNIRNHDILSRHADALENHRHLLADDIMEMEKLVPGRPGGAVLEFSKAANTEYPFFASMIDPVSRTPIGGRLYTPENFFTAVESRKNYEVSWELLTALKSIYPPIGTWKVRLPRAL